VLPRWRDQGRKPVQQLQGLQGDTSRSVSQRLAQTVSQQISAEALILQDKNPRYHYLSFPDSIGLPPSIIDFKHYFTIDPESVNEVIGKHFVCSVGELFREDVSQRFAAFLSRIGLPPI